MALLRRFELYSKKKKKIELKLFFFINNSVSEKKIKKNCVIIVSLCSDPI